MKSTNIHDGNGARRLIAKVVAETKPPYHLFGISLDQENKGLVRVGPDMRAVAYDDIFAAYRHFREKYAHVTESDRWFLTIKTGGPVDDQNTQALVIDTKILDFVLNEMDEAAETESDDEDEP